MSELHDPPLRLTIEGLRWMGDEWEATGSSATVMLHGTDVGVSAEILRLLRQQLSKRLTLISQMLVVTVSDLDFDAPNAPTEDDMRQLEAQARNILNAIEGLRELAPEVIGDDDDGGDDETPEPDPPAPALQGTEQR